MGERSGAPSGFSRASIVISKPPVAVQLPQPDVSDNRDAPQDEPRLARWLNKLGGFCRVVLFDKRGTGLSDRVANLPVMDERMDDVRAVMDAVGIERASLFGLSEGGSLAALFAASHPERTQSLILYGAFARFFHWHPTDEGFDALIQYIDE